MKFDAATDAWELVDAAKRNRFGPNVYLIESLAELFRVHPGDRVELRFCFRGRDRHGLFLQNERHWLVVTKLAGDHGIGRLETRPFCSDVLPAGATIAFEHRHIASIERKARR